MQLFMSLLLRDLTIASRKRGEILNPIIFFGLIILLFPIGISASEKLLAEIAPGLLWIAALLATMLSLDNLFNDDFRDGTIEQWVVSRHSLLLFVYARLCSHWLIINLPLIIIAPLFALSLNLEEEAIWVLVLSLILGTPLLTFIGAMGVALTTGLNKSSMLLPLLVLPFYIPVLIFGASAVEVSADGWSASGQLYILAALFVLGLTLAPLAITSALKVSVSQ